MPRFQIFVFQGAEMASFFKKCKIKFGFFEKKNQFLSFSDLTEFFHLFYNIEKKILRKKTCQNDVVKFFKFQFLEKSKTLDAFLEQSGHFWTWKMQNLKSRHQN